jgi:septum formation protein
VSLRLVLASASPRRESLLRGLGLAFEVLPSGIPEDGGEGPALQSAPALALAKAREVAARLAAPSAACGPPIPHSAIRPSTGSGRAELAEARIPQCLVLGADTIVECEGKTLGKPADAAEARAMLRALSGRTHQVVTGAALVDAASGRAETGAALTEVTFLALTDAEIAAYVETGEPFGKAGAYAIQEMGGLLVEGIRGSPSNVIGLPVTLVQDLLRRFGLDLWTLRR